MLTHLLRAAGSRMLTHLLRAAGSRMLTHLLRAAGSRMLTHLLRAAGSRMLTHLLPMRVASQKNPPLPDADRKKNRLTSRCRVRPHTSHN
jgi:hypothetical protein